MISAVLIKLEHAYLLASLVAMATGICVWNLRAIEADGSRRALPLFALAIAMIATSLIISAQGAGRSGQTEALPFLAREAGAFLSVVAVILTAEVVVRVWSPANGTGWIWTQTAGS